jgi:hypothetical protein
MIEATAAELLHKETYWDTGVLVPSFLHVAQAASSNPAAAVSISKLQSRQGHPSCGCNAQIPPGACISLKHMF